MAREQANEALALTSVLYGGNAAYIEDLYAAYEKDPSSVDAEWRDFFGALKDGKEEVAAEARGATWQRKDWPIPANGELVSALDGNWGQVEKIVTDKVKQKAQAKGVEISEAEVQRATRDSVRAIMMIRAYRMRGHLHANLDPLGIATVGDHEELHPSTYGFSEADYGRKIFIDNVLGLEFATIPQMLEILKRTYCSTLGGEVMQLSVPAE